MRPLAILLALAICVGTYAAPVVRVIEDFEGAPPDLPDAATVVEMDGNRVLRWKPERDQPWFLELDFSGTELDEWDRLEMRYRVQGAEKIDWWGVKVVDFPLGDGYQIPYRVPPEEIALDEWTMASIKLHPAPMKWGDAPDTEGQRIILRASGVQGEAPVFLIDDIRVMRQAYSFSVEPGEAVRDGDRWRRAYTLGLQSATDEALTVNFEPATVLHEMRLEVPDPIELGPGEQWEGTAYATVPAQAAPLSRFRRGLAAVTDEGDRVEKQIAMAVPLPEVEHPVLLVKREDLPRIRERIETHDWARQAWDGLLGHADNWVDREIEMPDRGGQWYHWYTCEKCGARLQTVSPTEHECPSCGATYSGWPYDDVVIMRRHNGLSKATRDLGLAYAITEDDRYAAKAREILLGYADVYLDYPMHNKHGKDGGGACHVGAQPLSEATWLIPIVQGFDCVWGTLSESERERIAERVLLPAAKLVRSYATSIHNIPCWENSAYGLVGIALGNAELASDAINGEFGFRNQIEQGVTDDGMWYEGAWGYHYYTMMALEPLAVAAEHIGDNLYSDRYLSMFTAPVRMMGPTGMLPAFNDSGRTSAMGSGRARLYENAAAHWEADELGVVLGASDRSGYRALLFGPDELPTGTTALTSTIFPAAGVAMLRSDMSERPQGLIEGVPANSLALDYGPHGSGHGHPDKLGFEMHVAGRLFATDAGSVQYGNPAHRGWYKQTLSHNTVVVDGESQNRTEGELLFHTFGADATLVGAQSDGAYHGVTLRRVMALLPEGWLDLTVALSEEEHQYDWLLHGRGDLALQQPISPPDAPPGEGAYEWAEDWQSVDRPDRDNRLGVPPWQAEWQIDEELTVRLAHVGSDTAGELFTAIGRGNPATARDPFIMSRATGHTAAWATVAWWGTDEMPEVSLVHDDTAPAQSIHEACGMRVRVGDREFALVSSTRGGGSFGSIELDGSAALVELRDGRPVRCLAADAARVTVDGSEL